MLSSPPRVKCSVINAQSDIPASLLLIYFKFQLTFIQLGIVLGVAGIKINKRALLFFFFFNIFIGI